MCIVLLTTAHPSYALVVVDNRDEFILRPTSRAHWWTHPETGTKILSARDLQRAEKGTWLGITDHGVFAVLTNYRETDTHDAQHPVHGQRSRGGMVTAWLGTDADEPVPASVQQLVKDGGVKGVGGFSMVAGKLKKRKAAEALTNGHAAHLPNGTAKGSSSSLEPTAIISNRCDSAEDAPYIGEKRGEVYGLSNTSYLDPDVWPKVADGKRLVGQVVEDALAKGFSDDQLVEALFKVMDRDTLPAPEPGESFEAFIPKLKESIFIPPIGDDKHRKAMAEVASQGKGKWDTDDKKAAEELQRPDGVGPPILGFDTGMYGTQRQTVILVDWDGNVTFRERALWDSNGNPVERGQGDVSFNFKVQGWDV